MAKSLRALGALSDWTEFDQHLHAFTAKKRAHIKLEEDDFLFMAQHILSNDELAKRGRSMAKRRGA